MDKAAIDQRGSGWRTWSRRPGRPEGEPSVGRRAASRRYRRSVNTRLTHREARRWGDSLVTARNNLDHGTWRLQSVVISEAGGKVTVSEPAIEGTPVTQLVSHMTDRVLCFVEDVIAHGIQKRLPLGIMIAEIPLAQRSAEMPLRFKPTVAGGGIAAWKIYYHGTALNET
jgi:hypothetical protein